MRPEVRPREGLVEEAAVVGVTEPKKVLADAIAKFSGTHTRYFATKEEALDWLVRA